MGFLIVLYLEQKGTVFKNINRVIEKEYSFVHTVQRVRRRMGLVYGPFLPALHFKCFVVQL